jgi:hypothetical protein
VAGLAGKQSGEAVAEERGAGTQLSDRVSGADIQALQAAAHAQRDSNSANCQNVSQYHLWMSRESGFQQQSPSPYRPGHENAGSGMPALGAQSGSYSDADWHKRPVRPSLKTGSRDRGIGD